MPITGISFINRRDLHLIRGQADFELGSILEATESDNNSTPYSQFAPTHPEVELEFRPLFKATLTQGEFQGFGIRISSTTGTLKTPGPFSGDAPQNFIVEVRVKQNGTG